MSEPVRDGVTVREEQVAIVRQAVEAAQRTTEQQQASAGAWLSAGVPEGRPHGGGPVD